MKRGESGLSLLLGIDKPAGITSHDVVGVVRRSIGERRVGHAGTLDPAATGVMLVGVGQGTRLMGRLTAERKSYLASIVFGCETTTDDAEGEVTRTVQVDPELASVEVASQSVASLVGRGEQVPPAYSAISVGGVRAYKRARAGEEVELEPRPMEIFEATLISCTAEPEVVWQVALTVSKGTYVRAIARDLGRALGSAAHLGRLCRTASGNLTLPQCMSLAELERKGVRGAQAHALDPVRLLGLPVRRLVPKEAKAVRDGQRIAAESGVRDGESVSVVFEGRLMGIWRTAGALLLPEVNFPGGVSGVRL